MAYDVFISAKSEDYPHAHVAAQRLREAGLSIFFADQELPELGESDYRKAIAKALEASRHMLVVASSRSNAESEWVEYEWGTFLNEKRSRRKSGNLATLLCGGMEIADLPIDLRQHEARPIDKLSVLLKYFKGRDHAAQTLPLANSPEAGGVVAAERHTAAKADDPSRAPAIDAVKTPMADAESAVSMLTGERTAEHESHQVSEEEASRAKAQSVAKAARLAVRAKQRDAAREVARKAAGRDGVSWEDAVQYVVERGSATTALLQRKLNIDYSRASRVFSAMEESGIVGPMDNTGRRWVLSVEETYRLDEAADARAMAEAAVEKARARAAAEAEKAREDREEQSRQTAVKEEKRVAARRALDDEAARANVLWSDVVQFAVERGAITTSILQRKFNIDYPRASRLLAVMERFGVLGPADPTGRRWVRAPEERDRIFEAVAVGSP